MSFSKMVPIAAALLAGCGMKINVNGKTRVLGGGDEPPAAASAPSSSAPASSDKATTTEASPTGAAFQTQTIAITAPLTGTPLVADVAPGITLSTKLGKRFGGAYAPCGNVITSKPVVVLDVKVAQPTGQVTVTGAAGFVLARGTRYWSSCDSTVRPDGGLEAGTYEVYPLLQTFYDKPVVAKSLAVGVSDPSKAPVWSERVQRIAIAAKLEKPMLVEVAIGADRHVRGESLHGSGCHRAAFRIEPDVALELARPIKGLRIRVAPSRTPPALRMSPPATSKGHTPRPYCARDSELRVRDGEDGTFGISVGASAGAKSVTLIIYDDSTTLDPLVRMPLRAQGATEPLEMKHRALAYHFPFLTPDHLTLESYARAEIAAKVFKTAPAEAFVYAKLDLDKEIASSAGVGTDAYPHKNEPLLVVEYGDGHSRVLAQDGLTFGVKTSHLLPAPEGESVPLAAPRLLRGDYDPYGSRAIALLPPGNEALAKSLRAIQVAHDACVDRVSAPYNRRLPTITRPANVDIVVVRSPRAQAIIDARDNAIYRACGSSDALTKKKKAQYQRILARVEVGRRELFELARR